MPPTLVIEAAGLGVGYLPGKTGQKVIHPSLHLQLYAGQVTSLLGTNGAGKSTLLRTLGAFQPPLWGEVRLMGHPLAHYSRHQLAITMGVVLTEQTNAGGITVYELAALGRHPYTGFFGQLGEADRKIIQQALQDAGIAHKARHYLSELSDGERQKALIAKVLAQQCPVILLDEPTAFLDIESRIQTMLLLRKLAQEQGKAVLLSTHDLDLAIQTSDALWLLQPDRPLLFGTPEDLILNGLFQSFFGKGEIVFDPATGKLAPKTTATPITVSGDPVAVHWMRNALRRNGFNPLSDDGFPLSVYCASAHCFVLTLPDGTRQQTDSIAALLKELKAGCEKQKKQK